MFSVAAEVRIGWPETTSVPTTSPFTTVTRTRTVPLIRAVLAIPGYEGKSPWTRKGRRAVSFLWLEISGAATSIAIEITKNAEFIGNLFCENSRISEKPASQTQKGGGLE